MFGKKKAPVEPVPAGIVTSAAAAQAMASTQVSPEIIAVITAAIAAMTGSGSGNSNGFIVRKISRIHGENVTWNTAGLMECIDSRRL